MWGGGGGGGLWFRGSVSLVDTFWPLGIGGGERISSAGFSIRASAARCLKFSIEGLRVPQVYKEM